MINFLCNFSAVVLLRSSVGDMEKHINHLPNSPSGSRKGFSVEKLKHAANWGAAIWPDRTSRRQVAGHLTIGHWRKHKQTSFLREGLERFLRSFGVDSRHKS